MDEMKNHLSYLSRFYEPKITAYEFLKCFFAYLYKLDLKQIDRDLVGFLFEQKQKHENEEVMEEINFKSNGVNYFSDDFEDALYNLQNGGLLGKMNPSFGVIIIKYTDTEANEAISSIDKKYQILIENIAKNYIAMTKI